MREKFPESSFKFFIITFLGFRDEPLIVFDVMLNVTFLYELSFNNTFCNISVPSLPLDVDYEGHVSENGGVVRVIPEIRAENGPICGFRIVNNDWGQIPFEVRKGISANYSTLQILFI